MTKLMAVIVDVMVFSVYCLRYQIIELSKVLTPFCVFRGVTGLMCPVCGGTHAIETLLNGDLTGAICYNAFVVFLIVYFIIMLLLFNAVCIIGALKAKKIFYFMGNYKAVIVIGVFAGAVMIYNNVINIIYNI